MLSGWILYTFLLLARVGVSPFLPGYVHPDEFFQGGQELWFGCPPTIPWEFEPDNALRSVIPPTLMTWIPLQIYSWLSRRSMGSLSGIEVLVVPRIACALLSILTVDWSIWRVCNKASTADISRGVPIPVLLVASAWPAFVMLARPFSNSLESFFFALLFCTVVCNRPSVRSIPSSSTTTTTMTTYSAIFSFQVGTLSALGIFTRFTFAFFAFPVLLSLLHDMVHVLGLGRRLARSIFLMATSFSLVAFGIVVADSQFYSSRRILNVGNVTINDSVNSSRISPFSPLSLVLTPYNALAYNSQVSNLEDHGLHPRWTHATVNMFILYGPLTLAGYLFMLSSTSRFRFRFSNTSRPTDSDGHDMDQCIVLSQAVILFGLAFLSVAPHQEPRFLLPLICPIVLIGTKIAKSKVGIYLWVAFNVVLFALFGLFHQAGVTKSLLEIGSSNVWASEEPVATIYLRTYMPPTFLTRIPHQFQGSTKMTDTATKAEVDTLGYSCREGFRQIDLNGARITSLEHTLVAELDCLDRGMYESNRHVQLVVPAMADTDENGSTYMLRSSGICELPGDIYNCNIVRSCGPHLTTEDFPTWTLPLSEFVKEFALHTYKISCK